MSTTNRLDRFHSLFLLAATLFVAPQTLSGREVADGSPATPPAVFKVSAANERMEMTVESSRILSLDEDIPRVQVGNKDLISVTVLDRSKIQLHAKKPGVTEVNLWGASGQVYAIDVIIHGDARELMHLLRSQFPHASLTVTPTATSVILGGYVDRPDDVPQIISIAKEFYPNVHNNMRIGGSQQVTVNFVVAEVDRTGLRDLGFDFANISTHSGSFVTSGISGMLRSATATSVTAAGGQTVTFGVIGSSNSFFGLIAALERDQLVKVMARPSVQAVSGRPAYFLSGGEIPILVPQSLGTVSIDYRKFGSQVDFVPIVLGNGRVRLEVRPRVTELDPSIGVTLNGSVIPGFRTREIDTGAELNFGETLVLAGLQYQRVSADSNRIPWLGSLGILGVPFRRNRETINEVELLILCTPEASEAIPADQVPQCLPGDSSCSPSSWDLYMRGYLEVPNPNCVNCEGGCDPNGAPGMRSEEIPAGQPTPAAGASSAGRTNAPKRTASSGSPRTAMAPANSPSDREGASGSSVRTKPYNRPVSDNAKSRPQSPTKTNGPGLIGPSGYDVNN